MGRKHGSEAAKSKNEKKKVKELKIDLKSLRTKNKKFKSLRTKKIVYHLTISHHSGT